MPNSFVPIASRRRGGTARSARATRFYHDERTGQRRRRHLHESVLQRGRRDSPVFIGLSCGHAPHVPPVAGSALSQDEEVQPLEPFRPRVHYRTIRPRRKLSRVADL